MLELLPNSVGSRVRKRQHQGVMPAGSELAVVGVHALLFDDDAVAKFINSPDALLPWNGDESLLIDRYDVRHLLQDLSGIRKRRPPPPLLDVTEEELDNERYRDLEDLEDNNFFSEEVLKSAAGEYRSVPFSYSGKVSDDGKHLESGNGSPDFHPPFPVPDYLLLKLPPSQKIHQIMVGTAKFVSEHGGQSEIIVRVKQGDNPMFGFLNPDHYLHEYFRFLVKHPELVGATVKSEPRSADFATSTGEGLSLLGSVYGTGDDDDDDDENSAQASASIEEVEGCCNDGNQGILEAECLVASNAKMDVSSTQLPQPPAGAEILSEEGSPGSGLSGVAQTSSGFEVEVASNRNDEIEGLPAITNEPSVAGAELLQISKVPPCSTNGSVSEPPVPLNRVIGKMVEFIARNGKEFEAIVRDRDKNDGRFQFLLPWNQYHPYYLKALEAAQADILKQTSGSGEPGREVILNSKLEKASSSQDCTSPADHVRPSSQEKSKSGSGVSISRADTVVSRGATRSSSISEKKKMKIVIGKKDVIQPNKNEMSQTSSVKADGPVGMSTEAAVAVVKAATCRLHVGFEPKAIVDDIKSSSPQSALGGNKNAEYGMTADAAAAVVMAATRGLRRPRQDNSNNRTSGFTGLHQRVPKTLAESSLGGGSEGLTASEGAGTSLPSRSSAFSGSAQDEVVAAKVIAQAAAFAAAHEADSADAWLTPAEKLKAERLRRAKMFAAMIKSGQTVPGGNSEPGGSLGLSVSGRAVGASEAVGSVNTMQIGLVHSDTKKDGDGQGCKDLEGQSKDCIPGSESIAEVGSSLKGIANGSVHSNHQSSSREHREKRHHEHLKKRKSHHGKEDEDLNYQKSKRSHHNDDGEIKEQKKKLDPDIGERNRHKSKRSYGDNDNDSECKDHHRMKMHRSVADEDRDSHKRKKSHHDKEEDRDRKHGHSRHKQPVDYYSDSGDEEQRGHKHRRRSASPSEVQQSTSSQRHGYKESKDKQSRASHLGKQSQTLVDEKIGDKGVHMKGDASTDVSVPTVAVEEVPDDIRAKVRALLLACS